MKQIQTQMGKNIISTQKLLGMIREAVLNEGETDFEIFATGQHMIGGPLFNPEEKPLTFRVHNPGQRVGAMAMLNTTVIVETPAPADAGWLCSGGTVILKYDGGDTTAHCLAGGKIYVGGKVGARSGSLMKDDPQYPSPEFWVLESTGSFSFEFMGGGISVICGLNSDEDTSVLGYRSCVGMVGGKIYARGNVSKAHPKDIKIIPLNEKDWTFIKNGMPTFLESVNRMDALDLLLSDIEQWHKIIPKNKREKARERPETLQSFKTRRWFPGTRGLFSDILPDDKGRTFPLSGTDEARYLRPVWVNTYRPPCEYYCPSSVPTAEIFQLFRDGDADEAFKLWLKHTPFPASVCGHVCPKLCAQHCTRSEVDFPVSNTELARLSLSAQAPEIAAPREETVAIIGGGPGGISAAWQLAILGYKVTVFEADHEIAGKMWNAIPPARLARQVLGKEISRIKQMPIEFVLSTLINESRFDKILQDFDRVVVSVGANRPRSLQVSGSERVNAGLDFLKSVNREEATVAVAGSQVVIIGAGNVGMDVAIQCWDMGAAGVKIVDIQRPMAYGKETEMAKSRGTEILWPKKVEQVTDTHVIFEDGDQFPADLIFIAIGEMPETDWIKDKVKRNVGGWINVTKHGKSSNPQIYACGDAVKPGLITDAIGSGHHVALAIDADFRGEKLILPDEQVTDTSKVKKVYVDYCNRSDESQSMENKCLSCGTCRYCDICQRICPTGAITKETGVGGLRMVSDDTMCIGCGFCASSCPSGIWRMVHNF